MKTMSLALLFLAPILFSGCNSESTAGTRNNYINCSVEIQIAVVSGRKPGDTMNAGDWQVVSSCLFPIHSIGGPGTAMSNTDGTIMQIQWSNVQMARNDSGIIFENFKWAIANRIDRRDGVSQTFGNINFDKSDATTVNSNRQFNTDFDWIGSLQLDTASDKKSDRQLVIRGRFLAKQPTAEPLNLAELTEAK